ncbi:Fungal specific transcription factor domain [Geosmithia morbida]|uniref:Fungal specific transcription factor domain n=1 Tax=Geosmithia morbida TaxID=1094350 RepID=A0A9P5D3V3_9HYPO|nr:Fungal specific transcription factor domain [Geosmithia morbida]KAF4126618.1 Fungal specific transcription factor domain [Geosmithia morbida]
MAMPISDRAHMGQDPSQSPEPGREELDLPGLSAADEPNDVPSNLDGPVRKRRRSRKGLDKRFECPAEGCGKSYSRAEHLYRHQLNHNSKQVYRCEHPGCTRTFVRGDLLKRHMDRHTAKGSQLSRRDSSLGQASPTLAAAPGSTSPEAKRSAPGHQVSEHGQTSTSYRTHDASGSYTQQRYAVIGTQHQISYRNDGALSVSKAPAMNTYSQESTYATGMPDEHSQSPVAQGPSIAMGRTDASTFSPIPNIQSYRNHSSAGPTAVRFVSQSNVMPFNLPPSQYQNEHRMSHSDEQQSSYAHTSGDYADAAQQQQQSNDMMLLNQMAMAGTVPVFGTDGFNKSPYAGMPEDFLSYLFNNVPSNERSPISRDMMRVTPTYAKHFELTRRQSSSYGDLNSNQLSASFSGATNPSAAGYFPVAPHQVMAVNNILDQNVPEATISDEKSQEIFDFISQRFHQNDNAPAERRRDSMTDGDRSSETHMLSKRMMQAYIGSYWYHFSDQMPILHKPTFSPDRTPNLLLIAMMTIGAALLDRTHSPKVVKAGAKLSNFLAWQLRWEIFMDENFRPPAKLWVFQTLILLELYEKMYSTRELHERAHIHHATTIQLMRRGRALIGKSAAESPSSHAENLNGSSRQSSAAHQTADEWWKQWIVYEATRRAAFAAFVIDSVHATMFGHSGVMVAHEMRLPLPCDESLWQGSSSAEVGRIEANLLSRGIKPISFLEGLKRTLSNQEVHTNFFGRTVLMAGLLSVSWHMHQRDLQVNVLGGGVTSSLGGRDRWRATLTRAYDTWRAEADKALLSSDGPSDPYRYDAARRNELNVIFESRTVLHHLAHMAMHADIVDLQVFARSKRLLGRAIGPQEFKSAERRIRDGWAPSARARDAAYYALKFLCSVLIPDAVKQPSGMDMPLGGASAYRNRDEPYQARDDVLLNRPWVLYFAMLVVWSYGFALQGKPADARLPTNDRTKEKLMRDYLIKFGSITDPSELQRAKGFNDNTGALVFLRDTFDDTRWELLHEGARLLDNCIILNTGDGF